VSAPAKFLVVAAVAAVLALLVEHNVDWVAGPWYWRWPWRRIDPVRVLSVMLVAAAPVFLAQWLYAKRLRAGRTERAAAVVPLLLVTLALAAMMLASAGVQKWPFHLKRIADVVTSPYATSYHTDAAQWMNDARGPGLRELLRTYPQRTRDMHLHSRLRPPGPVLFHAMWIGLLGPGHRAAMAAGLALVALAALSAPATYVLVRQLAPDARGAAIHAACFVALSPGLVWFTPSLDQVFPVLTALLLCLWTAALRRDSPALSLAFGLALAAALFVTFNVLVLGVFLLGITLVIARARPLAPSRVLQHVALAALSITTAYVLLWLATRYNILEMFLTAVRHQAEHAAAFDPPRPYPATIPFDLLDFLLGAGWIAAPLLVFYGMNRFAKPASSAPRWAVRLALLQIVAVAVSGTLAAETARVWLFLQPLLALPIGRELATWPFWPRVGALAAQFALMISVGGNMWLVVE
jgi:hypothetical protein